MKKIISVVLLMLAFHVNAQDSSKFTIGVLSQLLNEYAVIEIISQDFAQVGKNGKWGVVDYSGKLIIPLCDRVPRMNGNTFIVGNNDEYGGGVLGLIDNNGNALLPMSFTAIYEISDGMICVRDKNNKYGYVNENYKLSIPCIYESASAFHNGYAKVSTGYDYKVINKEGEQVDDSKLTHSAGFSYEEIDGSYKFTIYDSLGNTKVESFDYASNGSRDGAVIVTRNNKKGLVTTKGVFIPCNYDDIKTTEDDIYSSVFNGDLAVVKKQGKWGVIDRTGKQIIQCLYDYINTNYNIICAKSNGKYRIFDGLGKQISSILYDYANPLGENAIHVRKVGKLDGKNELIDKNGKVLLANFQNAKRDEGYVVITESTKYVPKNANFEADKITKCYVLDNSGNIVLTADKSLHPLNNYFARVEDSNGKYGVINNEGECILPCEYDENIWYKFGIFVIEKEGKRGFADINGKTTFNTLKEVEELNSLYNEFISHFNKAVKIVNEGNYNEGIANLKVAEEKLSTMQKYSHLYDSEYANQIKAEQDKVKRYINELTEESKKN